MMVGLNCRSAFLVGSRLDVSTVSAEITVKGVSGTQRLQTVSGEISTDVATEEAEVKTVSGDVILRGEGTPSVLTLTTVSGNAQASRVAGEVTATTVSGDLNLSLDAITRARLRTTSGNLSLRGVLKGDARVDGETISGDLSFVFKSPVDAEFDIETFSGDIDNCFGPKSQSKSEHGPGRELHFRQGQGNADVRVNSLERHHQHLRPLRFQPLAGHDQRSNCSDPPRSTPQARMAGASPQAMRNPYRGARHAGPEDCGLGDSWRGRVTGACRYRGGRVRRSE